MRPLLAIPCLVLVVACAQDTGSPIATSPAKSLVQIDDGGELVEVQRNAEFSIIEVRRAPSGSVASAMYALRGACAVARARGARFLQSTPVPGAPNTHKLTFPITAAESQLRGPAKSIFSLSECEMLRF